MTSETVYVETSVVVGILLGEPDSLDLAIGVKSAGRRLTGVNNAIEAAISVGRRINDFELAQQGVLDLIHNFGVEMVAAPVEVFGPAVQAYERYGKGRQHPAQLNFGDCISLAMAQHHRARLLYKGNDFALAGL